MTPSTGIKKVAVIGPECTGKSDLSSFLAEAFNTVWVPEYAREFIGNLNRPYHFDDLLTIAAGQLAAEDRLSAHAKDVLICDTNLYVIKVWSEFRYQRVAPRILQDIRERTYDLYLLTYVDIPWEADPQREHPEKREELYEIYRKEMQNQSVPYVEVKGARETRQATALHAVRQLLGKQPF